MNRITLGILALWMLIPGCSRGPELQPEPGAVEAGVPIYPGAKNALAPDRFSQRLLPQDRAKLVKAVVYETEDPSAKVISFYKDNLKGKWQVLEAKHGGLPSAVFRVEVEGQHKLLMISQNEDAARTEIVIGNIEAPQKR